MFYHWIRSDVDKQLVDYPYAKFNKNLDINEATKRYTDQEYAKYLRDDDWTKAETDRLFDLIFAFDMRWHVIHDRFPCLRCHNMHECLENQTCSFFHPPTLFYDQIQREKTSNFGAVEVSLL